jgi:putative FmdB family regulatory protein
MPTYDYRCNACGKEFEHFQSMSADALKECLCGKNGSVERLISRGSGIIFKGSGFYVNDYKSPSASTNSTEAVQPEPASTGADS